jgi:negative regulator of replication initiation
MREFCMVLVGACLVLGMAMSISAQTGDTTKKSNLKKEAVEKAHETFRTQMAAATTEEERKAAVEALRKALELAKETKSTGQKTKKSKPVETLNAETEPVSESAGIFTASETSLTDTKKEKTKTGEKSGEKSGERKTSTVFVALLSGTPSEEMQGRGVATLSLKGTKIHYRVYAVGVADVTEVTLSIGASGQTGAVVATLFPRNSQKQDSNKKGKKSQEEENLTPPMPAMDITEEGKQEEKPNKEKARKNSTEGIKEEKSERPGKEGFFTVGGVLSEQDLEGATLEAVMTAIKAQNAFVNVDTLNQDLTGTLKSMNSKQNLHTGLKNQ